MQEPDSVRSRALLVFAGHVLSAEPCGFQLLHVFMDILYFAEQFGETSFFITAPYRLLMCSPGRTPAAVHYLMKYRISYIDKAPPLLKKIQVF
jgi:hypothetical protein